MRTLPLFLFLLAVAIGRAADAPTAAPKSALPRLIDLGADKCIPCRMMTPVLAELTKEYAGQLDVLFIDVWKNREEGPRYGIRIIPTQIFFDSTGKELFRHEGFYAKKDILAKWKELGIELREPATAKRN
jgi:thioredoxin 1